MLSQPGLPIVLAAVISSILSGTLLIVNNIINNKFQLEREKEQSIRQQESDQQKWYREKVYASYTKAIQILTEMIKQKFNGENDEIASSNLSMIKLFIEFDSEYIMIIRSHPAKESNTFKEKISEIDKSVRKHPWIARDGIIEIMEQDSRIKPISNNIVFLTQSSDSARVSYNGE
jgi:hypothetical protein